MERERGFSIGNVKIKNRLALGPMAGVTDQPFRLLCREQGCGLLYTEMVSAKAIFYNNKNTKELLDAETEKEEMSPLSRMWNVLVKIWNAIVEIFKER